MFSRPLAWAFGCILAVTGCARAPQDAVATPPMNLTDCEVPGASALAARCGALTVWENRQARSGRQIPINFVVLPATGGAPAKDPVFYFDGGPGGSAASMAAFMSRFLSEVHRERDLVFVDARGTGRSNPLRCPKPEDEAPLQRHFDEFLSDDFVGRCLQAQDADVRYYTQPFAMDDVNDVRAALGYDRINLYGASGGTRQEQIYMRRHGATVRSVVMHGVQPMDAEMPLAFSRAMEVGIRGLLDACAKQAPCASTYPNLKGDWERVKRRFDDGDVEAEVSHPRTGVRERVRISRGVYADGMRHMLYNLQVARQLPAEIHAAARGNFDAFAQRELRQSIRFAETLAFGMFMSATCAEDVRFIDEEDIRRATEGTFLGDYRVRRQQAACRIWPRGEGIEADFQQPVRLGVPVLILSGDVDVATPPADAERVARALPNARHIIFPNQGHVFANPACASRLITDFITSARTDSLDVSCVSATTR